MFLALSFSAWFAFMATADTPIPSVIPAKWITRDSHPHLYASVYAVLVLSGIAGAVAFAIMFVLRLST
jgi:hypothetical protein